MLEDIVKVALLALLEGLTEFLPVSSTGHLIVGKALLNFDAVGSTFEIFIQLGAVLAVLVYYRRTLLAQARALPSSPQARGFWRAIALACIPTAVVGFSFQEAIETHLFSPDVIALSLIGGGLIFLLLERAPRFAEAEGGDGTALLAVSWRQALVIGCLQILALVPGVSRSGSAIIGGMLAGLSRRAATEFSFFLAIPLLGGTTVYKLWSSLGYLNQEQLAMLFLGAALAAVFAWLAIDWLLNFVARNSFLVFGYYRVLAGLLILAATAAGIL